MATRRKYKSPPAYRDGGAVPSGAVIPDEVVVAPPGVSSQQREEIAPQIAAEPVAEGLKLPAASPAPSDDGTDALIRAHAAQIRAEQIQRDAARAQSDAARPQTIDDVIAAIPGITEHKRRFLRENPNLLQPANVDAVRFHYQSALSAGVVDDTPEMNRAILAGMYREREFKDKAPPADAPPAPRAPIAAPRKSLPMAAPPSRSVPSYASGKPASSTKMTLSAEERDIARKSIINRPDMPPLSDEQKEFIYLKNRNRYRSMLADGSYSEQGNGGSPPPLRAGYRDE